MAASFAEDIVWPVTASLITEDSARQLLSFFAQNILLPRKQQCQGMWAEIWGIRRSWELQLACD